MVSIVSPFSPIPPRKVVSPLSNTIEQYQLHEVLGSGKFGTVHLASLQTGEKVVVKRIRKGQDSECVGAEAAAGFLLTHPNLIKLRDWMQCDTNEYLVAEYFEGVDLYAHLENHDFKPLSEEKARAVFSQLASVMNYIHSCKYVHRDLKLENVLINQNGHVKLIDFGLCGMVEETCSSPRQEWVGSEDYAAPELLRRESHCAFKCDVWALGTILYVLLFGELPFDRQERRFWSAKVSDHPQLVFPTSPQISEEAKDLISLMLTVDPTSRGDISKVVHHKWLN